MLDKRRNNSISILLKRAKHFLKKHSKFETYCTSQASIAVENVPNSHNSKIEHTKIEANYYISTSFVLELLRRN